MKKFLLTFFIAFVSLMTYARSSRHIEIDSWKGNYV